MRHGTISQCILLIFIFVFVAMTSMLVFHLFVILIKGQNLCPYS